MKPQVIIFIFITIPLTGRGQYFQYSQYNFTDQRVNPAMVASSDYSSLDFIFRNQTTGGRDVQLRTSTVSAVYPFLNPANGKRWSGIGLSMMDDRSGGIFTHQEASLSYAINVVLGRNQSLSLGFKGLYQQRRADLNGLVTGSQYIHDRGFDESLYNGENVGMFRSDFITFSSGLYWQQHSRQGKRLAYWGISFFDFNKPDDSFSGVAHRLNSTLVASGGITVYQGREVSVMPEFLLTSSASNMVVSVGAVTSYTLKPRPNQIAGQVDVITKYIPGRSGILGMQFSRDQFSIGISYDFPLFAKNPANLGAFELGLRLKRLVDPDLKRIAKRRTKREDQRQTTAKAQPGEQVRVPASDNTAPAAVSDADSIARKTNSRRDLATTLRYKQDSVIANARAGRVRHEPFVIERTVLHFSFDFNSSDLDAPSVKYLEDLSTALKENDHMHVSLTGHTDNVGSSAFNLRLSLSRANAIREFLVGKGIEASRITAEGKGLSEPLNENKSEAERALNRRVELVIYYQE